MKNRESPSRSPGYVVDLIVIVALWCVAVITVKPIGNFPLNDDWSYGLTVKHLLEHAEFRPTGWTSMPFITQALWGALFCLPKGFSFTALRFSTLTLSLAGVVSLYLFMRQLKCTRWVAGICALMLAFNPIYFALSNSFMTDVPFTTMVILTLMCFVRYFRTGSLPVLLGATLLAIAATLCRQLGLAIPLAFTFTVFITGDLNTRARLRTWIPSVFTVASLTTYNHWLRTTGRVPSLYYQQLNVLLHFLSKPWTVPSRVIHYGWNGDMYLGCFLLPLLVLVPLANKRMYPTWIPRIAVISFIALIFGRFIVMLNLMPVGDYNVLDARGIGPLTLKDTFVLNLPHMQPLPVVFWMVVTALSLLGASFLAIRGTGIIRTLFWADLTSSASVADSGSHSQPMFHWRTARWNWPHISKSPSVSPDRTIALFFLVCVVIYLLPLAICGFFDRYLIPALVFLTAFFAVTRMPEESPRPWQYAIALLLIAGSAYYSVAGTRDYLTWNRTRWIALNDLQRAHVPADKIDGGFEFNGWHFYNPEYWPLPSKSFWWVVDDEYLLCFGEMTGYEKFKEYDYARWLPPSRGTLLVLKRRESANRNSDWSSEAELASFNLLCSPPNPSAQAIPR